MRNGFRNSKKKNQPIFILVSSIEPHIELSELGCTTMSIILNHKIKFAIGVYSTIKPLEEDQDRPISGTALVIIWVGRFGHDHQDGTLIHQNNRRQWRQKYNSAPEQQSDYQNELELSSD